MADKWIQLMSENGTDNLFPTSKMDLLWTNATPGTAVTNQTISLDLSTYKYILVVMKPSSQNWYQTTVIPMDLAGLTNSVGTYYGGYYRGIIVSTSGVTITSGNDAASASPFKIYGIK